MTVDGVMAPAELSGESRSLVRGAVRRKWLRRGLTAAMWLLIAGLLWAAAQHSYLLFHTFVELFSVIVAAAIFVVAWNTRRLAGNDYLLVVGIAYGAVAIVDLLHLMTYRGMEILNASNTNVATQLWLVARVIESGALAVAPWFFTRRANAWLTAAVIAVAAAIPVLTIFNGGFPTAFVDGAGLTTFKIFAEWCVAALFVLAALNLWHQRAHVERFVLVTVICSVALRVASELAFTLYHDPYAFSNFLGHVLKLFAIWLLYAAWIRTGLVKPFTLLFRDLKQKQIHLEATIKELETFTYSVSHDLRSPLMSISGFAELLADQYGDELTPEAREWVERISRGSMRMKEILEDILNLSRISQCPLELHEVNVSAIANEILSDLGARAPGRKVEAVVAPSIVVHADERLTRVLLENLIGNAWKFTGKKEEARIQLDAIMDEQGHPMIRLRDNGAGFDPARAANMFSPFQRLHSDAEFAGTGVGLATAQRIVQRHGGTIRAEGKPGEGATFYVKLA